MTLLGSKRVVVTKEDPSVLVVYISLSLVHVLVFILVI